MGDFVLLDKINIILKYMSLGRSLKIDNKIYKLNPDFTMVYRNIGSNEFVNVPNYMSSVIVPYLKDIDDKKFNEISDLIDSMSIVGMIY